MLVRKSVLNSTEMSLCPHKLVSVVDKEQWDSLGTKQRFDIYSYCLCPPICRCPYVSPQVRSKFNKNVLMS